MTQQHLLHIHHASGGIRHQTTKPGRQLRIHSVGQFLDHGFLVVRVVQHAALIPRQLLAQSPREIRVGQLAPLQADPFTRVPDLPGFRHEVV